MTYHDALAYLESFVNYERLKSPEALSSLHLERMRRLCEQLGDPQRAFRSIVVAGTNGKGSISAMLYSMLRESRLRVGLYTSPHLEDVRERLRTWSGGPSEERRHGEDWITQAAFCDLLERVRPLLERWREISAEEPPTYFEILTAMAFEHFRRQRVEIAVLEVGLGGRLDATNVVEQAVSVIAPIDLDHVEILGRDAATIAGEKAGIIKPRQRVIAAPQHDDVWTVLQQACAQQGAPLWRCDADLTTRIRRHDLDGLQLSITGLRGLYDDLEMPLVGRHQATNAALAVAALEALSDAGAPRALVEQGLARVECPGRIEVIQEKPLVILDGAHNPQAARALADTLQELCAGRRIHLLIGTSADKSVEGLGEALGPLVVGATCSQSRHPRALDAEALASRLLPYCPDVHVIRDPVDAYTYLLNAIGPADVLVVTGSFYFVGPLRAAVRSTNGGRARRAAAQM